VGDILDEAFLLFPRVITMAGRLLLSTYPIVGEHPNGVDNTLLPETDGMQRIRNRETGVEECVACAGALRGKPYEQ